MTAYTVTIIVEIPDGIAEDDKDAIAYAFELAALDATDAVEVEPH